MTIGEKLVSLSCILITGAFEVPEIPENSKILFEIVPDLLI